LDGGFLYVDDKWNRRFRESRVVPICPTLSTAIQMHLEIHNAQFIRWKLCGFESKVEVRHTFLVDVSNQMVVPVTPSNLDRLCEKNESYFEGMKNGPRHFLLSRLYSAGVNQEIIDFLSGHRHASREPEMSASPVSWKRTAEYLRIVIENEIVDFLQLEVPLYE